MTQPTQQDVQQLTGAIGTLATLLESWPPPPPSAPAAAEVLPSVSSSTGGVKVTVNMGGWGVAVAALCAAFCLLLVIDQRSDVRDANRKIERAQDYNNLLWRNYPELRESVLKAREAKEKPQ